MNSTILIEFQAFAYGNAPELVAALLEKEKGEKNDSPPFKIKDKDLPFLETDLIPA